jgi:hypothetical protein
MKRNICQGIFSSGKCVLTKAEGKRLGLKIKSERTICVNCANKYGECDMKLLIINSTQKGSNGKVGDEI